MKKEKSMEPRMNPCGTSQADSKRVTFVILKNHASMPVMKERLNLARKASRETAEISL